MLMHGRPLVYRRHAFWRGRTVAQRAMRSDCVEVVPPTRDQDLCFAQRIVSDVLRVRNLKEQKRTASFGVTLVINQLDGIICFVLKALGRETDDIAE